MTVIQAEAQRNRREITRVPVAPIRKAILKSELTVGDVADALGWRDSKGRCDTQRLKRRLGITPYYERGRWTRTKHVEYETAVAIILAAGLDPWKFGV